MANKKRSGLGAIFGDDVDALLDEISRSENKNDIQVVEINIDEIHPNPYQPRKYFSEEALRELADSILEHGILSPIWLRKSINGYDLISGERRYRAAKLANLSNVPSIILDIDDKKMMEITLLENIQREDLNIIEEARGYEQLINRLKYTQEELAKRIGKSRSHISNIMRILRLPSGIQDMLYNNEISFGHARALLNIEDENHQEEIAQRIKKEGLSVREVEGLVKNKPGKKPKVKYVDPYLEDVRKSLERKYSTSVKISNKAITINYNDNDDLNRILEIIGVIED